MSIVFSHPCTGTSNTDLALVAPAIGSNLDNAGTSGIRINAAGTAARRIAGGSGGSTRTNQTLSSADYTVRATVTFQGADSSSGFRLFARFTDLNNHYTILWFNGNLICRRVLAGANTQLGSTVAWSPTTGVAYVYELIVSGSNISVKRDGSTISGLGGTDTQFTTALNAGWQLSGTAGSDPETTGWILDDLQVELAAGGASNAPRSLINGAISSPLINGGLIR